LDSDHFPSLQNCQTVLANLFVGDHSARTNSIPVHIIFSHYLAGFLPPTLQAVLNWMITHDAMGQDAEGRPSTQRRFSASQIAEGYFSEGMRMSWGCGCNRGTVLKALSSLESFCIIRRISDPHKAKKGANGEFGCLWELELNFAQWDWGGLQSQLEETDSRNQARSQKARQALEEKRAPNGSSKLAKAPIPSLKQGGSGSKIKPSNLSHKPINSFQSVQQTDPIQFVGLSDSLTLNTSVGQTDHNATVGLFHNPIRPNNSVPQTDLEVVLINESINKQINNGPQTPNDDLQEMANTFRWAFARSKNWQNEPNPLTNALVAEMGEWLALYGKEKIINNINLVSRLPDPPPLERAFGLVRHYLKKVTGGGKNAALNPRSLPEKTPPEPFLPRGEIPEPDSVSDRESEIWSGRVKLLTPAEMDALNRLRGYLRGEMDRASFDTWLAPARLMGRDDHGALVFGAANKFVCEWLENRLGAVIHRFLSGELGVNTEVAFCVLGSAALGEGK
jgi:hypothetical protein